MAADDPISIYEEIRRVEREKLSRLAQKLHDILMNKNSGLIIDSFIDDNAIENYYKDQNVAVLHLRLHGTYQHFLDNEKFYDFISPMSFSKINITDYGVCNYWSIEDLIIFNNIIIQAINNIDIENPKYSRKDRLERFSSYLKHFYDLEIEKDKSVPFNSHKRQRFYARYHDMFKISASSTNDIVIDKKYSYELSRLTGSTYKLRHQDMPVRSVGTVHKSMEAFHGIRQIPTKNIDNYEQKNIIYDMIFDGKYGTTNDELDVYDFTLGDLINYLKDKKYDEKYDDIIIIDGSCSSDELLSDIDNRYNTMHSNMNIIRKSTEYQTKFNKFKTIFDKVQRKNNKILYDDINSNNMVNNKTNKKPIEKSSKIQKQIHERRLKKMHKPGKSYNKTKKNSKTKKNIKIRKNSKLQKSIHKKRLEYLRRNKLVEMRQKFGNEFTNQELLNMAEEPLPYNENNNN